MLGPRRLLVLASASALAWAGYLPESASDVDFRYNLWKRVDNGTSFNGPYSTHGRDIVNSKGEKVVWAGVNWPMSGRRINFKTIRSQLTINYRGDDDS